MRAQVGLSMDNLEAVLAGADMTLADVVRFNIYTADVDELFASFDIFRECRRAGRSGPRTHPAERECCSWRHVAPSPPEPQDRGDD